jgi:hypothetical protein
MGVDALDIGAYPMRWQIVARRVGHKPHHGALVTNDMRQRCRGWYLRLK